MHDSGAMVVYGMFVYTAAETLVDCAISLNPSPSGSLRTTQDVSKYIIARCSEVYAGQCGSPL